MWPILAALGLYLFGSSSSASTTPAPLAPGALGLGGVTSLPAGTVVPLIATLTTELLTRPQALAELAAATARAPADFVGLSPDLVRVFNALAAQPALAPQLAAEISAAPTVRAQLAATLQTHGPLALTATTALLRLAGALGGAAPTAGVWVTPGYTTPPPTGYVAPGYVAPGATTRAPVPSIPQPTPGPSSHYWDSQRGAWFPYTMSVPGIAPAPSTAHTWDAYTGRWYAPGEQVPLTSPGPHTWTPPAPPVDGSGAGAGVPADRVAQGRRALELLGQVRSGQTLPELAALQTALGVTPADGAYSTQAERQARAAVYGRTLRGPLGAKAFAGLRVLEVLDSDPAYRRDGRPHPELAALAETLGVPGTASRDGTYSGSLEQLARAAVLQEP